MIFFPIPMARVNFGSEHAKGNRLGSPAAISGFEIIANGRTSRSDALSFPDVLLITDVPCSMDSEQKNSIDDWEAITRLVDSEKRF